MTDIIHEDDSGLSNSVSNSSCVSPTLQGHSFMSSGNYQDLMIQSMSGAIPTPERRSSVAVPQGSEFNRNSRLTKSFTLGKQAPYNKEREKSKQKKRDEELRHVTAHATQQVEYVVRLAERLNASESENNELRRQVELMETEIGKLVAEIQDREAELVEKEEETVRLEEYCEELQRELGRSRRDMAQARTRADQLRVENTVLNDRSKTDETEVTSREVSRLKRQIHQLERQASSAQRENEELKDAILHLQEEHQRVMDDFGDDRRSKKELLQVIRQLIEDKVAWENYAVKLVKSAVKHSPKMLQITADDDDADSRWENLFQTLLGKVLQTKPSIADSVLPEEIVKEAQSHRVPNNGLLLNRSYSSSSRHTAIDRTSQRGTKPIMRPQLHAVSYSHT